jgi:hypothetical protein
MAHWGPRARPWRKINLNVKFSFGNPCHVAPLNQPVQTVSPEGRKIRKAITLEHLSPNTCWTIFILKIWILYLYIWHGSNYKSDYHNIRNTAAKDHIYFSKKKRGGGGRIWWKPKGGGGSYQNVCELVGYPEEVLWFTELPPDKSRESTN